VCSSGGTTGGAGGATTAGGGAGAGAGTEARGGGVDGRAGARTARAAAVTRERAGATRRGAVARAKSRAILSGSVHETDRSAIIVSFIDTEACLDFRDQTVENGRHARGTAAEQAERNARAARL
jgi:hypothetical protein